MRSSSDTRHWPETEGLDARMTSVAAAVGGAALVGGLASASAQRSAGNKAADAQQAAADRGIAEQQRQFDTVTQMLAPYRDAGTQALGGQLALAGLGGGDAQQQAIAQLQNSPAFQAALRQGENSILQNASATGNLRGGNVQAALGQFSPQLLAATINDQYNRLGGLTTLGQNAATMTGSAGLQTGNQISQLLQQQGAAQAGAYLNQGKQTGAMWNSLSSSLGTFAGLGGSFSDRRLKTNIVRIGTTERGNPRYRWDWIDGSGSAEGVIADEVSHIPGAVHRHESGFDVVDYSKV